MEKTEQIFSYLEGQMSSEEKLKFEKELALSPELKSMLEKYRNLLSNVNDLKNISVDQAYFTNLIPNFRSRLGSKHKKKIIPKLALGLSTLTAVIIVALFVMQRPKKITAVNNYLPSVDSTLSVLQVNLNPVQDNYDLSNLSSDEAARYDSVVTSMISTELDLSSAGVNYMNETGDNTDLKSMLQGVNEDEANKIYNELLHKKIL